MNAKERFIVALERKPLDRLPVTTHHVQEYFLNKYLDGMQYQDFFDHFGLDPILWINEKKPDESKGDYFDPTQKELGFLEPPRICNDHWRIETENVPDPDYDSVRFKFITPQKTLSMIIQSNEYTSWVLERLIKEKADIEIIQKYRPIPLCDVALVNQKAEAFGNRGMVRGFIPFFDVYGQSGCWQDAAVLYGIENLIMATFDDPEWVHQLLGILLEQKKPYIRSMTEAKYDIIEHGGGDASTTVISPKIFDEFVAPYDEPLIALAHKAGQRVVYHTCGGMMPILQNIADMNPDAMETFTPAEMGGDINLKEAKKRIGDRVCMIGGFDQFHHLKDCSPDETRRAVRTCFEDAGREGGYILAPSDHFFDADLELIRAFADEAKNCRY